MAIRVPGSGPGPMQVLWDGGAVAGLSDSELLDRFKGGRGEVAEAAFAALVHRHGPMVLGLCRRIIVDRHAADDAFQATFLILAMRAGSVRVDDTLGRWLHGVGRKVALRERAIASRRPRAVGPSVEGLEAPEVDDSLRELTGVLDEEIARLPARSREVVRLCHFEGLSFHEAATRIGCPIGTVGSRLTRARAMLGSRLARRGFAPAAILVAVDSASLGATVSPGLVLETARYAANNASATIPAAVASLGSHTLRTMMIAKFKIAAVSAALALGMLAAGARALQAPASRPPSTSPPASTTTRASTPAQEYEALVRDYRALIEEGSEARKKGKLEEQAFLKKHPVFLPEDQFGARFLELARSHPADPSAFDALLWVVVYDFRGEASDQAATILARDHSRDPRLWPACQELRRGPVCPAWGILLRAIHRDNPDRAMRGRAGLALADYLMDQAEFVRLAESPGPGPYQGKFFPAARMEQIKKLDPDAMALEAEEACERVIRDYPEIKAVDLVRSPDMDYDARKVYQSVQDAEATKGTIGDRARAILDEIRSLAIGKSAPSIEGPDDQGKPMSLADFRGKVVLLTFSGDWCGPCVSMYPNERELVKRLDGRPFALLSVNSDDTREQLLKSIGSRTITWRCWWEPLADEPGPISERWHVRAWPSLFVIDHRGVIRAKSRATVGPDGGLVTGLDEVIEGLVREAERDAR